MRTYHNKILSEEVSKELLIIYINTARDFQLTLHSDIVTKLILNNELLMLIQQCYHEVGKEVLIENLPSKFRNLLNKLIDSVIKNGKTYGVTKKDIEYLKNNVCKLRRKKVKGVSSANISYDKEALYSIAKGVCNNEQMDRKTIYSNIKHLYQVEMGEELTLSDSRLCNYISYHKLIKPRKGAKILVHEYIAPRYKEGQRLFFANVMCKELGISDATAVKVACDTHLFPGISIINSTDYIDNNHSNEYISKNKERLVCNVMIDLKEKLPHARIYELCNIMSRNVFLHHRYMNKREIKLFCNSLYKLANRIYIREKILKTHGVDITTW